MILNGIKAVSYTHLDVYKRQGYAMLCSNNPQEVMDLGAVAHLSTLKSSVPFLHFFDGFRTSHEMCIRDRVYLLRYLWQ